jgi:transposase
MEVVYQRCCGLDVHKDSVTACLVVPGSKGTPSKEVRSFGTTTGALRELAQWLAEAGCTTVAMESTGVYWKPLYNLLEGQFDLLLVNPQHIKAIAGRKTDVKDAEWIADLLRHGLLKGSFVPDRERRELRELTRYRISLVQERARELNRLQKVLEGANIKLGSVVSDIGGVSARLMLEKLAAGSTDVSAIAELAKGRMRDKIPQLEKALTGSIREHQRFVVARQLAHIDALDELIQQSTVEIEARMSPLQDAVERLDSIPGVGREVAQAIVAEIGVDMSYFATSAHLASWAGLCPGNDQSAGKQGSGKIRKGNKWLKAILVQAAQSLNRSHNSYLASLYHRIASRRGKKRAAIAVAHAILVIAYHLLSRQDVYRELGAAYLDQRNTEATKKRLVRRLEALGYQVSLTALPDAA